MEPKIHRYVLMLANEKNFSKAAQKLHLSQPSLSYQIAKLEKELGLELFIRGQGEIQLTYAGETFVEHALKIVDQVEQLKNELFDVADLKKGRLNIGSLATTGAYLLPKTVANFKKNYPGVELVLIEDSTTNLELLVSNGQVEISLLSMPIQNTELEIEVILEEEIVLAVPRTHSLAKRQEVNLSECRDESFILIKQGAGFRKSTENLCKEAGFIPNVVFESININTCQALVSSGMGISFVPKMVVHEITTPDSPIYVSIKNPPHPTRKVVFAYKNGRYLSKAARIFIDIMKDVSSHHYSH